MESIACELVTPYVGQELTRIWNWKTAGWPVPTTATWPSFGRKHSLKWMFKISSPSASKYQVWRPRGHQVSPTPAVQYISWWALYDLELNPEGKPPKRERTQRGSHPRLLQGDKRWSNSSGGSSFQVVIEGKKIKLRKTLWDLISKPHYKPPAHWREMMQVAGKQEILWREMVQKIIFTDTVCKTSTPTEPLNLLLHF